MDRRIKKAAKYGRSTRDRKDARRPKMGSFDHLFKGKPNAMYRRPLHQALRIATQILARKLQPEYRVGAVDFNKINQEIRDHILLLLLVNRNHSK